MDIRDYGGGDYLKAADLKGQDVTLVISSVVEEGIKNRDDGKTENKPVVSFNGTDKKLVLNVTNGNTIGDLLGFDTDAWIGGQITLWPTQTEFAGRMVDCIRVRVPSMTGATPLTGAAPAQQPAAPAPDAFRNLAPPAQAAPPTQTAPAAQQLPPTSEIPF